MLALTLAAHWLHPVPLHARAGQVQQGGGGRCEGDQVGGRFHVEGTARVQLQGATSRLQRSTGRARRSCACCYARAHLLPAAQVCVIRIGGPVADTAPKAIAAPVGATPFPHSACVGISGGGYNGALRRRFTFHGAYHPPSGTAWAYKIYDAPPEGATAAPTSTVKTPKAPKPAAGGSGDGGFSKTLVRAGLDTSAILPTASRERRPAPPRVELASAVTPPQAEKAGAAAIAASLGPDMAAMAEILAALQADVFCADFLQPVDWERHGLPDYPTIVKKVC